MKRPFLIDTDTASDDAVAILMALSWPDVDVKGITTVSGNVPVHQAAANALYTCQVCGRGDVPVFIGAEKPLMREPEYAFWFHGDDGMGNQHYPTAERAAEQQHAVDALIDIIKNTPGITLVTLGALTNVAIAVKRAPEIMKNVERCVIMGGAACTVGNVTPAAEYNIWVDPEAAHIVFHSGLPIEMVGWEHSRGDSVLKQDEIDRIVAVQSIESQFIIDCNRHLIPAYEEQTGEKGMALPDAVAMAIALESSVCTQSESHFVDIETKSELTRGATIVDLLNVTHDDRNVGHWRNIVSGGHKIRVVWKIDPNAWKNCLFRVLE